MSNLKNTPWYPQQMKRLGYIDSEFRRISGRPPIPPFQGAESVIWLSLSKLLVNLLQVVKRTNTPLLID